MSTILVVDDDTGVRQILREYIELEGHRVIEAPNATSARKALAQETVDLIFLDVMMPGESGTSLCHCIKDDPECQGIKVILITGFEGERAWSSSSPSIASGSRSCLRNSCPPRAAYEQSPRRPG